MNCVIVAAGDINDYNAMRQYIHEGDYVIAADGGYRHLSLLGVNADYVLGDFDSLGYVPREASEVHPAQKDDTDAMLAVKHGLLRGLDNFVILGGLGGRLDHTLANIAALAYLRAHGVHGLLIDERTVVRLVGVGDSIEPILSGGYLSVFPFGGDSAVLSMRGVMYPVTDCRLDSDFPLGTSNRVTDREAFDLRLREGAVIVVESRMDNA